MTRVSWSSDHIITRTNAGVLCLLSCPVNFVELTWMISRMIRYSAVLSTNHTMGYEYADQVIDIVDTSSVANTKRRNVPWPLSNDCCLSQNSSRMLIRWVSQQKLGQSFVSLLVFDVLWLTSYRFDHCSVNNITSESEPHDWIPADECSLKLPIHLDLIWSHRHWELSSFGSLSRRSWVSRSPTFVTTSEWLFFGAVVPHQSHPTYKQYSSVTSSWGYSGFASVALRTSRNTNNKNLSVGNYPSP